LPANRLPKRAPRPYFWSAPRFPDRATEALPSPMLDSLLPLTPAATGAPLADAHQFREGMSRVAAAVHVVTTDGPAGRAGFTATAVTPVTDDPPSLLVCINAEGRSATFLAANGAFCVNTLAVPDREIADIFAGRRDLHGLDRFAAGSWDVLATGSPALASALVSFDCRLTDARLVATHHVMIGRVVAIRLGESRPALIYYGRAYRDL
jgi:flavin reductase (DIM6/NTAB) family NADH-FMN oxidoreductase RutF